MQILEQDLGAQVDEDTGDETTVDANANLITTDPVSGALTITAQTPDTVDMSDDTAAMSDTQTTAED